VTGGNPNLQLEKGDTFTAGVVLKPRFLPRFNMSVDYYKIKVKGAIDTLSATAIANACNTQNQLCNLITFSGAAKASNIVQVQSTFQNLSRLNAEGYELVMDYSLPLWEGNLAFQLNANYVKHLNTITATGTVVQLDNWTGNNGSVTNIQGVPRYKIDGLISYVRPTWSVTAHPRYIPRALLDPTHIGAEQKGYDVNSPLSQTYNHVDARFYLDLSASVKLADTRADGKIEMYGQISNVFDKTEPKQLRLIGNPLQFDPILRAFRIGVRATY
jgi:outer membrane receptor protein involved in Fe transport